MTSGNGLRFRSVARLAHCEPSARGAGVLNIGTLTKSLIPPPRPILRDLGCVRRLNRVDRPTPIGRLKASSEFHTQALNLPRIFGGACRADSHPLPPNVQTHHTVAPPVWSGQPQLFLSRQPQSGRAALPTSHENWRAILQVRQTVPVGASTVGVADRAGEFRPYQRLTLVHGMDFISNAEPREHTIEVDFSSADGKASMVVTVHPHVDPRWTRVAVEAFKCQLAELDSRFEWLENERVSARDEVR